MKSILNAHPIFPNFFGPSPVSLDVDGLTPSSGWTFLYGVLLVFVIFIYRRLLQTLFHVVLTKNGTKYLSSTQTDSSAHYCLYLDGSTGRGSIFGKALQEACSNNIALNTPFIGPFMFLRLYWMLYQKS